MKVAYLINQYPKTSHTFIRREIQALERAGVEITRISLRGWDAPLVDQVDIVERKKTRYVLQSGALALLTSVFRIALSRPVLFARALALTFRMGWRAERPLPVHFVYLAEACLICGWLKSEMVQHLHAHFGTNSAEVAMLTHKLGGPSWSFTVHGPEEFDKPHFIGLPEKVRRSSFVIAISSYGRSQLFRLVEPSYWTKIHVVRCGLERTFYDMPVVGKRRPTPPRFICVGRLCEQKGHVLLLQAASRLRSTGINFELVLAGDGEMRKEIEQIISSDDLGSIVWITGWVDSFRIREELLNSTALILPSFAEGLPVVIMEGMSLSLPVISTFVGGIPELVVNGETGWLVPAGDLKRLTDAMETCVRSSDSVLDSMGALARQKVLQSHNVEIEIKLLRELFEEYGNAASLD
jgi:colanic acid/amylovoran biosynthesis glycosyltransferase